eukprot:TRINITY_DN681_c3_g1_i3.p1 TRINITY_DN681_c3_g1~~TRINITY_DN681_c3_g1_i3.p1  ORF type:complete len:644 (-),score=84.70 TRINITY_DN681_c3_g1_i3:250-2181(-)
MGEQQKQMLQEEEVQQQESPIAPWTTSLAPQDLWLLQCCICGREDETHRCSGCPRVFHLSCLNPYNCLVCQKIDNEEEQSAQFFCRYCCQKLEDNSVLQSPEDIEALIGEILAKCEKFPSAHPANILGQTLQILSGRRKRFRNLGWQYGGTSDSVNGIPQNLTDLNYLVHEKNFTQISLEEGKVELGKRKQREECNALLQLTKEIPKLPIICKKLQDVRPVPNGRSYVNMLVRDGVCTPPNCKISKILAIDLRTYVQTRFNKHINNINQRLLKKQLIEGGFKELRLNYYMRYEMTLDEIKQNPKFSEIVGKNAPWMRFVNQILGENCELMEILCQITRPGAPPQSTDSDESCSRLNLKNESNPPYAVTVFIPLVDLVAGSQGWNGAFEFHMGTHRQDCCNDDVIEDDFRLKKVVMALQMGHGALVDFRLRYRCLENCSNHETYVVSLIYVKKGFKDTVDSGNQNKPSLPTQDSLIGTTIPIRTLSQIDKKRSKVVTSQRSIVLQEKKAQRAAIEIQINAQSDEPYKFLTGQKEFNLSLDKIGSSDLKTRKIVVTQGCQLSDMENLHFNSFLEDSKRSYQRQNSEPLQDEENVLSTENSNLKDILNGKGGIMVAGRTLRATVSRKATASEIRQLQQQQQQTSQK